MPKKKELVFKINAYSPETIPMARLAEYMAELALLLGEKSSTHFVKVAKGSTQLVHKIDGEAVPKVEARLHLVRSGNGPHDGLRAFSALDKMLAEDNTDGSLGERRGAEIIPFPGVNRLVEPEFGPFNEAGSIDGQVILVGGQQAKVPVHLKTRTGFESHCLATRDLAKSLGKLLFGPEIRCMGTGRWRRDRAGSWELLKFTITNFELLDRRPLGELRAELGEIEGNGWRSVNDPWAELARLRSGEEPES